MGNIIRMVSVSGGKDSTALYLWAMDQFGKNGFLPVFADTGHEHPVTYNYVRNLPDMTGGPSIEWVKADFRELLHQRKGMEATGEPFLDMMLWKGRAPSPMAQFCTKELKLNPIKDWLDSIRGDADVHNYVGIRAGESLRRSKMPMEEFDDFFGGTIHRPLLNWSEDDVYQFLRSKGVAPNPLYDTGFPRVGCFPCIYARKKDLARLPDWAWEKLERWEKAVGRSWFPAGLVPGVFIPTIADVKAWSKTARGGKKADPEPPDVADPPHCMSTWGHCE